MKQLFPVIAAVAILLIASCSKDPQPNTAAPTNGWSFKGNTYYTFISKFNNNKLVTVSDTTGNYNILTITFPSVPTANGTYRIINYAGTPAANQITVSASTYGLPSSFNSIGNDSVNATVTINNGKVTVAIPALHVLSSTTAIDTAVLTGTVTQNQ